MTAAIESEVSIDVRLKDIADDIFAKLDGGGFYDRVLSMEIRNFILPPNLLKSTVRSSTLAVAELQFKIKYDILHDVESMTFLVFFNPVDNYTQGVVKVSGELPCDLQDFFFKYVIPVPTNELYGLGYLRSTRPIPLSNFPGITAVHRYASTAVVVLCVPI